MSAVLNIAESRCKNVINAKLCVQGPRASVTEEGDYNWGWTVGFSDVSQEIDS